jgi:hypothetical protein
MNNSNVKLINSDKYQALPIINKSDDISFGALQYVESVIGALLQAKRADGPAWKAASKLLDVTVDQDKHVHLELKVHGIGLGQSGGPAITSLGIVKFEY